MGRTVDGAFKASSKTAFRIRNGIERTPGERLNSSKADAADAMLIYQAALATA